MKGLCSKFIQFTLKYEPCHEKTNNVVFKTGPTNRVYKHGGWLSMPKTLDLESSHYPIN